MKLASSALLTLALGLCSAGARANDSFGSEISHVFAGIGVASAVTAIADHYGAGENRGWIGFGTAVGLSFVSETAQVISDGSSQLRGSSLDFASALVGAAIGAWVTDRYLLAPVVARDGEGHRMVGVVMRMTF
jgi:hypothetical protein